MEKAGNRLLPLIVVFALVPLGPLAIDVYLPSIPQMMDVFGASDGDMRQTISIYILALGVSQLLATNLRPIWSSVFGCAWYVGLRDGQYSCVIVTEYGSTIYRERNAGHWGFLYHDHRYGVGTRQLPRK